METATAIGIDVGGTNIRAARISPNGAIQASAARPTASEPGLVAEQIGELFTALNDGSIAAIGIGLPGRVDAGNASVLSGGFVDLTGVPLAATLRQSFRGPVVLDNDCNMALVAEQAVGRARGIANVVMFTIGTGIGGAVFSEGAILRGRGTAGQLGHITVTSGGKSCLCGRHGCIETTSSGTALGRHITDASLASATSVEMLLSRSAAGDAAASAVLAAWAAPMRIAIDTVVAIFDPELVVLGGGLGAAMHQALGCFPAEAVWYQCPVQPAELGDRAGVIGAGLSALAALAGKP